MKETLYPKYIVQNKYQKQNKLAFIHFVLLDNYLQNISSKLERTVTSYHDHINISIGTDRPRQTM